MIDDREEHTRRTPLRGKAPSHISPLELSKEDFENKVRTESSRVSYKDPCDIHREITTRMMENRLYSYVDRWHHRIVYEEAAIHFYKLNSIKDMILVLKHSVECMSINLVRQTGLTIIQVFVSFIRRDGSIATLAQEIYTCIQTQLLKKSVD